MKISIIGGGFAGLSTAAMLAKEGHNVSVIEKHDVLGGRARQFSVNGFKFDMGPSWYWMPDVFETFFNQFNKSTKDYYKLNKLDPGFQMIFSNENIFEIPDSYAQLKLLFEKVEPGSSKNLDTFMKEAEFKYNFSMKSLIYNPGISLLEFINKGIGKNIFKLELFKSYKSHIEKYFKNKKLRKLLEFPVLFLGTAPKHTPALYSLMAYSGFIQGTYYPMGGFASVIKGIETLCKELGVKIYLNENVSKIYVANHKATKIETDCRTHKADVIIGSADYQHVDSQLLPKGFQNYNDSYWNKKVFSPSCLIFYLGINKKLKKLIHHNLFFDSDIEQHIDEIYAAKKWPQNPLFYACCPSKTDPTVSPTGKENLFLLVPIAPGLEDNEKIRQHYFSLLINRLENYCGENISNFIEYKKSYCINNFIEDYNAYKGNAYGLANTLLQTANLKPKILNKKVTNLFYTGQLTVPGPGVPPSLISGQIVANYINKKYPV